MQLYVGCAMWALDAWVGTLLPSGRGAQLPAYATWVTAVEGNTTFYAEPAAATVSGWAEQAPADFRFVFKLPRSITHEHRLRNCRALVSSFVARIEPLGKRASMLTVQLPASFGPNDLPVLRSFLADVPTSHRYTVELRHPAFFHDQRAASAAERVLGATGAEWTVFDTTLLFARPPESDAERAAWDDKPRVARRTQALTDSPVIRYLGRDDPDETAHGWQPWLPVVAAWLNQGRTPMFFVHTPDNVASLPLARRFHAEVAALVPNLHPLPDPVPVDEVPPTLF